ncbi:uncharacterized protein LOC143179420 [Calliopsis andreniformis]|uniref:uncharacterized protein LOC143179420 n=1 Tax=Calliopsis andreniformis TaxID=337506 RepID=UPI003FCE8494
MSILKSKGCLFLASSLCDGLEDNNIKQVTTLLLNKEANPNTLIPTYGVTPFHLVIGNDSEAFAEEVTKLFLRHGGNPNVRSADGLTPVHVAAAWGRVTVLELLLANGGDPLCLDDEGRSPFHYAFDGKYYKAIVVLGKYCENITKEDTLTKHKMTFDKLLINNGDILAEYAVLKKFDTTTENLLSENKFEENKENRFSTLQLQDKYPFDFSDSSLNSDDQSAINAAELRIQEEIDKEKCLVSEIINKLSSSLNCNSKDQGISNNYRQSKENQYNISPSSLLNIDDSMACDMMNKFSLKTRSRRHATTPRYRRKIFGHNKIPSSPVYNPNDSIVSKSPNCLIRQSVETEQRYLSPKVSNRETKFKSFTPCMTRNDIFRSEEFNVGPEMAKSTPRRRRRICRQYSSSRKFRKNNELTSSENTSPDSTNSLSPDRSCPRKLDYRNLAIKLHENKYDDDVPTNSNLNENNKYTLTKNLIESLNNNIKDLNIRKVDSIEKNEDLKRENILHEKVFEESRNNNTLNTFKENFNTLFSSFKSESHISVQEEYKYEDSDEGIAFLERRIYTLPPYKPAKDCTSATKMWPQSLNLSVDNGLTNEVIRRMLINLGENPGPITSTTRQLYLKRLIKLKNETCASPLFKTIRSETFSETDDYDLEVKPLLVYDDWVNQLERYKIIEKNTFKEFAIVDPSRRWREGINKTSFNYLLLDPRITKDLPSYAESLPKSKIWARFLSAIFYVGKGTRNRPLSHLKDAFDAWVSNQRPENTKVKHILNIWNTGYGIVCLCIFQNTIPVEAYTREAAMIEALGLQNLKNCKSGDYYGIAATWSRKEKCNFGRYLLHQAMQIFLFEGERQIFPQNV